VNVFDDLGFGQHQQVVAALEIVWPVLEPLATERGFIKPVLLDHGAHGAVENDDALGEQLSQGGCATIHWPPCASPSLSKHPDAHPARGRWRT
jgi:hypothetical protein